MPKPVAADFLGFLRQIEYGAFADEAAEALADVVAAIENAHLAGTKGAAGKITLTIALKRDGGAIAVAPDIKTTLPKVVREKGYFYATKDHGLTREDPRQQKIDLRVIDAPSTRVVDVTTDVRQAPGA